MVASTTIDRLSVCICVVPVQSVRLCCFRMDFVITSRSTQPCIPLGSLNRVPPLVGWGNGENVTSAGWQVTLCDPIWHVSSCSSGVLVAQTAIRFLTLPYYTCDCSYKCTEITKCELYVLVAGRLHGKCSEVRAGHRAGTTCG